MGFTPVLPMLCMHLLKAQAFTQIYGAFINVNQDAFILFLCFEDLDNSLSTIMLGYM